MTLTHSVPGAADIVCTDDVSVYVDGVCDPVASGNTYYLPDQPQNYTLCAEGVANNYQVIAGTGWTWDCVGINA